jgi:hypothetical protein
MLANVTVDRQPIATIRFMGGREYDLASGGWTRPIREEALASAMAKRAFALPSFAAGGPVPGHAGHFSGPTVESEERAAAALLYVALMTDLSLDLIGSDNTIVIDGGLVKTGLYAAILAALRPAQTVHISANPEGSAFGAAALVFEERGHNPFVNDCAVAAPADPCRARRLQAGMAPASRSDAGRAPKGEARMTERTNAPALLEMRDISKTFGASKALSHVNLTVHAGEVHALMGENGAGKSTLMKILSGAYTADPGGAVLIGGEPVTLGDPLKAKAHGIAVIYQELSLAPNLSVRRTCSSATSLRASALPTAPRCAGGPSPS